MAEEKDWKTQWCKKFNGERVIIDGEEYLQRRGYPNFKINIAQYELLLSCSQNRNITPWNEISIKKIWLCGANLEFSKLRKVDLEATNLQEANLRAANLQGANLRAANLQEANLTFAILQEAELPLAKLQEANLEKANLQKADFENANLQKAELVMATLYGGKFKNMDIEKVKLSNIKFDSETDFTGSNLDSAFIEPNTKGGLEYNIRRLGWHEWYKKGYGPTWLKKMKWLWIIIKLPARWFWSVSNYGISSLRIIFWFMSFSFIFAYIYNKWPAMLLRTDVNGNSGVNVVSEAPLFHNIYFSIVTMTTLGFGDVHANPNSQCGQVVLILQVLIGYVFLGALVTRLGVVFTGLGPVEKPKLSPNEGWVSKLGGWLPIILAILAVPCIEAIKICQKLGLNVFNHSVECLTVVLIVVVFIGIFLDNNGSKEINR